MGCHIVKTTVEISDDLFHKVQELARKENLTFRALTEKGLRLVLQEKKHRKGKLPPLVTFSGNGLHPDFSESSWEQIRDEIYKGRGS